MKLKLRRAGITVYKAADKTSPVAGVTPNEMKEVSTDYATPGLKDNARYWHVVYPTGSDPVFGYIHDDDVE